MELKIDFKILILYFETYPVDTKLGFPIWLQVAGEKVDPVIFMPSCQVQC